MMKKLFSRALICVSLMVGTLSICSCDSETIAAILMQLLETGTSYTYTGTGNAESLIANGGSFSRDKKISGNFNVTVKVASTGTSADLTIPAFTCGSLSMSECTFSSLALGTQNDHNVLSTDENNTTILGTVTYNGQTVDVSNLYIECTLDDSQINIKLMSIYFGEPNEAGNYPYAMNFSYSGKVVTM